MSEEQTRESHPSYGLLSIHRISGSSRHLFGSSVDHGHSMMVRVHRAERLRDLCHTWYMDTDHPIVEVEMSPAQFAEAITSPNMGVGVPCTIRRVGGETMPKPPVDTQVRELFQQEFKNKMRKLADKLKADTARAGELLAKKSLTQADRREILEALGRVHTEVASNIPFVHTSFDEAMDNTVKEAKAEFEAYVTSTMMQLGRQAALERGLPSVAEPPTLALGDLDTE